MKSTVETLELKYALAKLKLYEWKTLTTEQVFALLYDNASHILAFCLSKMPEIERTALLDKIDKESFFKGNPTRIKVLALLLPYADPKELNRYDRLQYIDVNRYPREMKIYNDVLNGLGLEPVKCINEEVENTQPPAYYPNQEIWEQMLQQDPLTLAPIEFLVNPNESLQYLMSFLKALDVSRAPLVLANRRIDAVTNITRYCAACSNLDHIRELYKNLFDFSSHDVERFQFIFKPEYHFGNFGAKAKIVDMCSGNFFDTNENAVKILNTIKTRLLELLKQQNEKPSLEDELFIKQSKFAGQSVEREISDEWIDLGEDAGDGFSPDQS